MTATINGERATRVVVRVPGRGAWTADVDLEEAPEVSGAVTIELPGLALSGTVVDAESGTHVLERRVRVIGGAGGWGRDLPSRAYHTDSQVRAQVVIEDAAREAGETLGDVSPALAQLGIDYVRQAGPAARALEDAIGDAWWWVGYDGRTHIGTRPTAEADPSAYEVLDFDPRGRIVTMVTDDLSAVGVGSVVSDRLDAPQTVRSIVIDVQPDAVRVRAWCGPGGSSDKLADAVDALVSHAMARRVFGPRKYRVVQMSADRVELQAVNRDLGLPDIRPISMWPGMAGLHASLTPGVLVLVEFIDGDRAQPIITHFVGRDGSNWAPASLVLDATSLIKLGDNAAHFVALANLVKARLDSIQSTFDAHIHTTTATVGLGPAVGVISPPTSPIGALADVAATLVKAE